MVIHNPDLTALEKVLNALMPQVGWAIIIDDCSSANIADWFIGARYEKLILYKLDSNHRIVYAKNISIFILNNESAKFFLLSGRDSEPAEDMVFELKNAANKLAG